MSEDFLSQDEEQQVLERLIRNQLAIKELEEENGILKQFFKDRPEVYPTGTHKRGRFFIKVTTNRRISQKKAEQVLTNTELRNISSLKVDTAKARAYLSEAGLEKIMDTYDNRLEVGLN